MFTKLLRVGGFLDKTNFFASAVLILFINYFGDEVSILRELNDLGKIFYILKMVFLGIALYLLGLRLTGLKLRDFVN